MQDHLERAFEAVCGRPVSVQGAGRTDAGVHASAMCAHADVAPGRIVEPGQWLRALNAHLPGEIRVSRCSRAPETFHARFSAKGKVYVYRIWNAPVLSPFEIGRAWHLAGPIDMETLKSCAATLTGTHDYAAFSANRGHPVEDTTRTVSSIRVRKAGSLLVLTFEGSGFLYKMVRLMTGTLLRCAQGKADPALLTKLLDPKLGLKTSFAAPAGGLCLARVIYC